MRLLLHTALSPAHDLALEESLHIGLEEGSSVPTWRLWQAREPAVILGTGQEAAREADLEFARSHGVRVLRRHSGGGAVLIGPGAINFSAFFRVKDVPGSETIKGAMTAALSSVQKTLAVWGLSAHDAGLSDLTVSAPDGSLRKIAGNSQARKKHSVVVHGTLLASPDWELLERVLPFPSKSPDYRAGRGHRAFLTSLSDCGAPVDLDSFANSFASACSECGAAETAPTGEELQRAAQLMDEKYARDDWHFRR